MRAIAWPAILMVSACAAISSALLTPDIDPTAQTLAPGDFHLDQTHAALLFRIDHLGYSDFIGRFGSFDARLSGDPLRPADARVSAVIDIASLDIANPAFADELTGPGWFDAGRYPQAFFVSESIEITGPDSAVILGQLTLRNITRPIKLEAKLNGSAYDRLRRGDVAGFSATTTLNRSEFGIDRFSGLVTDLVRIEIEAEFIRAKAGQTP